MVISCLVINLFYRSVKYHKIDEETLYLFIYFGGGGAGKHDPQIMFGGLCPSTYVLPINKTYRLKIKINKTKRPNFFRQLLLITFYSPTLVI